MSRPRAKAFTLLEVMAAMIIMATVIFVLLDLQTQAIGDTRRMKQKARAFAAAETAMDAFLAAPLFQPAGDVFESEQTVDVPGFEKDAFEVRRIITERFPLDDQETIYIDPNDIELELDMAEEGEEDPWDPGTFIAVRVEVWSRLPERLVVLETWLPKPPLTDEEEEQLTAEPASTPSSSGGTGGTSGPSRPSGPGRPGDGGQPTRPDGGDRPSGPARPGGGTR